MSVKFNRSIARTLTVAALATLGVAGTTVANTPAMAATTDVNMEKVVLAAQLDPAKEGTGTTEGAEASVKTVEDALSKEGFLDKKHVDGHFGTSTVTAYSKFQKSVGATGEGANGLPGKGTLTKLGQKENFNVVNPIELGKKTTVDGKTVNQRTADMIKAAEKESGVTMPLSQGSYNKGVSASAGTHDGGGAIDVSVNDMTDEQRAKAVAGLRKVGFAAWDRTGVANFEPHIHAIAISDTDLASAAWHADQNRQVYDYFNGKDGLARHGDDNGPKVPFTTWEDYKR
ncbi:peptidoglycan-binding domain-containing protein [uncultured Brevibacterium sp.]|mgnify:CR=1 FL=1|uniref:peptidoglycan-binding domain-containing protein n=1 Tax=uncultured Brevibacterium sp. TaxID=189678 RepID=UPI0025F44B9A|nr:peptidoglycan-binding domain-containing protein [uncultured Brevibacterium sp.]